MNKLFSKKSKKEKRIKKLGDTIEAISVSKLKQQEALADNRALRAQLKTLQTNISDMSKTIPELKKNVKQGDEKLALANKETAKLERSLTAVLDKFKAHEIDAMHAMVVTPPSIPSAPVLPPSQPLVMPTANKADQNWPPPPLYQKPHPKVEVQVTTSAPVFSIYPGNRF